jgi:hypothetical protein
MSAGKRALPFPDELTSLDSLRKHMKTLTSDFKLDSQVVALVSDYATEWTRMRGVGIGLLAVPASASASFETSVAKGGRAAGNRNVLIEIKRLGAPSFDVPLYSIWGELKFVPGSRDLGDAFKTDLNESDCNAHLLRDAALGELYVSGYFEGLTLPVPDVGENPFTGSYYEPPKWTVPVKPTSPTLKSAAVAVPEQGFKCRVVTKSQEHISNLLHMFRSLVIPLFEDDKDLSLSESASGNLLRNFNRCQNRLNPNHSVGSCIKSTDLSTATDRIPLQFAELFWDSFIRVLEDDYGNEFPQVKFLKLVAPLCYAQHDIVYPSLGRQTIRTTCGLLMGIPTSWLVLNIYTKFGGDLARARFNKVDLSVSYNSCNIRICGDDKIGTLGEGEAYLQDKVMEDDLNALVSPGVDSLSTSHGVFCESLVSFNLIEHKADWVDVYRPKAFIGPIDRIPGWKETPPLWVRGSSCSPGLSWASDAMRKEISTWVNWDLSEFSKELRLIGIPIFLPTWLGGFEMPHFKNDPGSSSDKSDTRMCSIVLRDDQSLEGLRHIWGLSSIWNVNYYSPLGEKVRSEVDEHLGYMGSSGVSLNSIGVQLGILPAGTSAPYMDWKTMDEIKKAAFDAGYLPYCDYVKEVENIYYSKYCFDFPPSSVSYVPSLRRVSKSFNLLKKEILASDFHHYAPLKGSIYDWAKRKDWKMSSLFFPKDQLPDFDKPRTCFN